MRTAALLLSCCMTVTVAAALGPVGTGSGVYMLDGELAEGRQPDGNTIFLRAPEGWIVIDTGRHEEHTKQILAYALPIKAIINTHWHLDHTGGNAMIRERWPSVRIYASDAEKLAPTDVITESGPRTIAGRKLELNLEKNAVTAGDIWIFDLKTKYLIAGDLVTLPVPLFDTACPKRWKQALDHLAAKDFDTLIPGHGFIMFRHSFDRYRTAFNNLLTCAASSHTNAECTDGWLADIDYLVDPKEVQFTRTALDGYLTNVLRAGGRTQCGK